MKIRKKSGKKPGPAKKKTHYPPGHPWQCFLIRTSEQIREGASKAFELTLARYAKIAESQ